MNPMVFPMCAALALAPLGAQVGYWSDGPAGFSFVHLAHDPTRHVFVILGNLQGDPAAHEKVFEYDGSVVRSFHVLPAGDFAMFCAFDPAHGYTVIVSYVQNVGMRTWSWDGTTLTLRESASSLYAPQLVSGAADLVAGTAVLHGRVQGGNACFAWDGTTWQQLGVAPYPTERVVTHPVTGRPVLQFTQFSPYQAWRWSGVQWQADPAASPPVPLQAASTDLQHNLALGFHGADITPASLHLWNGSQWSTLPMYGTEPAASSLPVASAFGDGIMLVDDGSVLRRLDLRPVTVGSFATIGAGCPGPAGIPSLAAAPNSTPRTGNPFTVVLANLPSSPFNRPFLFTGTNRTTWGSMPLPVDLGLLGMPGCTAWIAPEFTAVLANSSGTASCTLAVPQATQLVGAVFHAQGAVLVPGFNGAGLVVSNAGTAVIGTP
jgi:hypothetical protein